MDPLANPRIQEIGSYEAGNLSRNVAFHGESDGDVHLYLAPPFFFQKPQTTFCLPPQKIFKQIGGRKIKCWGSFETCVAEV